MCFHNKSMQFIPNRSVALGLAITIFTALSAIAGAPKGFEGFTVPVWDILLQFNLCTGFVFLILGVLEAVETPVPDFSSALQLFFIAFVAYGTGCVSAAAPLATPVSFQLFLFTLAIACLAAGWARFGLSALKQLDTQT